MLDAFREIVVVDAEFTALPGERPDPVCLVARELRSGRRFRLWLDGLKSGVRLPYATGPDVLFIAYYASAELGVLSRARPADAGAHPRSCSLSSEIAPTACRRRRVRTCSGR